MASRQIASLAMAALALAASCGQSEAAAPSNAGDSQTTTSVAFIGPTTVKESDAADDELASDAVIELGTTLSTVLAGAPGPNGWALPAGRWTSDAFEPPLTFETPVEMILRSESKDSVVLVVSSASEDLALLTMVRVGSVPSATGQQPPSRTADELRESIAAHPAAELIDESSPGALADGSVVTSFDVLASADDPTQAKPCWIGFECLVMATSTDGGSVFALNDRQTRIYLTNLANGRLRAYLTGKSDSETARTLADQIVTSLQLGGEQPPGHSVQSLGAVGSRAPGLPAGEYRTMLGDVVMDLVVEDDLPGLSASFSGDEMLIFQPRAETFLVLFRPRALVASDADQERLFRDEQRPDDMVNPLPDSSDDFLQWLDSLLDVESTGTVTVGDASVPLWRVDLDQDLVANNCADADSPAESCMKLGFSDGTFHWFTSEDSIDGPESGGWFYLPEVGIAGYGGANGEGPGFVETFQPLFDRIAFTR